MRGRAAVGLLLLAAGAPAPRTGAATDAPAIGPDTLSVAAAVSPAVVKIGEPVVVRFAVPRGDSTSHLVAPPAKSSLGAIDVLESEAAASGPDSLAWRLRVAFFEPGEQDVSTLPFTLAGRNGDRPLRLQSYRVSVESVLPDSVAGDSLRAIKGPMSVPLRFDPLRTALGLAALLAIAAAVVLVRRRRLRPPERVEPLEPEVSPETRALRALRLLDEEALPERGLLKEHFARLSLILREYLERRYRVPAVESTTYEIQGALERSRLASEHRGALLELLSEADLVKFAKFNPGSQAARIALDRSRRWIESAAPRFQPEEGA